MPSSVTFTYCATKPTHNDSVVHSTAANCPPANAKQLLNTDLNVYATNVETLLPIAKSLQQLCIWNDHELKKLQLQDSSEHSSQSGRTDSGLSKKSVYMDRNMNNRRETRVVFSPSNNALMLRPSRTMKDGEYIRADLPSFNPWSDTLHIYSQRTRIDGKSSQHKIVVTKKFIPPTDPRNATFIRTIKLGRLGIRVKLRRVFGNLDEIYVHFPPS